MKQLVFALLLLLGLQACDENVEISVLADLPRNTHPQIAYWFITPDLLQNDRYIASFDSMVAHTPFDMFFLSAREGCDFYDTTTMKPVFRKLVERAHSKGIKIGLQLWNFPGEVPETISQRTISEANLQLDKSGKASYVAEAKHIRPVNFYKTTEIKAFKTKLFGVFAFKKLADGVYDPQSLKDISAFCVLNQASDGKSAKVSIDAGINLANYDVYIMCEHLYNHPDMFASTKYFDDVLAQYASIPFDGTALDEFGYMRITPPWEIKKDEYFSERFYSPAMKTIFEKENNIPVELLMFHMRYHPKDSMQFKINAINQYMKILRLGPLQVENEFYASSKKYFGKDCFIGVHNTFHNALTGDEYWITGANWWTIKRDYGHTDEHTILPTQMGVAFCNAQNVIYNMYYHPHPDSICEKALHDLRYGIRTHYHAFNDKHWGVTLESEVFLDKVKPVEEAAKLLNLFNSTLPEVRLLVVFGTNEMMNFYPNEKNKSNYYLNKATDPEAIAMGIQNAGYMNALVPDDVIENGMLKINKENKAELNGHVFDAVVLLYPEYMSDKSLQFFSKYIENNKKLMVLGQASRNALGKDVSLLFSTIKQNALPFDISKLSDLGIEKNTIQGACKTSDNSYILTNYQSLLDNKAQYFEITIDKNTFSGYYKGLLAFQLDNSKIIKMASLGLKEFRMNGKTLLMLDDEKKFFFESKNNKKKITIFEKQKAVIPNVKSKL